MVTPISKASVGTSADAAHMSAYATMSCRKLSGIGHSGVPGHPLGPSLVTTL